MKRITVVDDDQAILEALELILTDEGIRVTALDKVNSTKEIIRTKPDLLILDLLLSGADGRDIAKNLRRGLIGQRIPIIIISARPTAEPSVREISLSDFLAKPFEFEELLLKI